MVIVLSIRIYKDSINTYAYEKWELSYPMCIVQIKDEKCNNEQGKEWRWLSHFKDYSYAFVNIHLLAQFDL